MLLLKKTSWPLFYGWGSTASRLQSHFEEAVYFYNTKFPEIPGTNLIDLGRMKD